MTAAVSREAALARELAEVQAVLDDLLAALADPPPQLRRLLPSPFNDWISTVRGKHAARRNQIRDREREEDL